MILLKEVKTKKVVLGIIGALFILIAAQTLSQLLAGLFAAAQVPAFLCNIAAGILYVGIAYLLLKLLAEKGLQLTLSELCIPSFRIKIKWLVIALILPIAVTGVYFLLPGSLHHSGMDMIQAITTACTGIFYTGLAAGLVEEMVFRGFFMNLLDKRFGRAAAILIPSLLFGALHIIGMDFSILSCLQVLTAGTLVGVMFSLVALEQASIWNSAAVHAIWNIIIIGGFLSVGEGINEYALFSYVLESRSFAITGGEFGIEASAIAILGYVAVCLIAYARAKKTSHRHSATV